MAKQAAGGVAGLLQKSGRKTATASKSSTPTITVPDAMKKPLGELIKAKQELKRFKGQVETLQGQLEPDAKKIRLSLCKEQKRVLSSVKLSCPNGTMTYVQDGAFKKMRAEDAEDKIRLEFGDDTDKFFNLKTVVTIDTSKLTDAQATAICKALGRHAEEILISETLIKPTEALLAAMIFDPTVAASVTRLRENESLVVQKQSYFK